MFYNAQYNQYVQEGTQFTLGDITYPPQWLNQATPEQKTEVGLVEVVATNTKADERFYWVSEELNGAELTYVNTPKDLNDLKKSWTEQVNQTAYSLLFPSDWMVVRAAEGGTPVPADWATYRASVRETANTGRNAIESAIDVDSLIISCKIEWPNDPNYVAPVETDTMQSA